MRFLLLILLTAVMLSVPPVFAQTKRADAEKLYQQLRQSFQQLLGTNPQAAEREKIRSIETWLQRNDWQELSVKDQAWLCDTISGPDQIDKRAFSVRWTGTIRVPATGSYSFAQLAMPGAEGYFKLWINDQLILDNATESENEDDDAAVQKSQQSEAVPLTAGTPASFRLEYVRTPVKPMPGVMRLPGFPAAVLAWQSEVLEQQVVPTGVFFTATDPQPGLTGEYFADTTFTKRVVVRIDPNIDFMWDVGRVATEYRGSQREIVSQAVTNITAPGFLNTLDADDAKDFIQEQLPVLFGTMTASERIAVLQVVTEKPELLKLMTFTQMSGALRWYSMLSDKAPAVDLLVKWSQTTVPPLTQPGFAPGRSPGGYLTQNVEPYFRLARLFTGDDIDQVIELLLEHVANEDGSCNLTLAYVLSCVCRIAGKPKIMADLTDAHLLGEDNEQNPGDIQAGWFIAEAFKYETVYSNEFKPGAGIRPIEKGLEVVQSPEMRFRLIGELVSRLVALDRSDEARSLVMSVRDQFADEDKQVQMDAWLVTGEEVKKYYTDIRIAKAEEADTFVMDEYAAELKRRADIAEQRGEQVSLQRYQKSIASIKKMQEEKERAKQETKKD